jgi:hypothetical protein
LSFTIIVSPSMIVAAPLTDTFSEENAGDGMIVIIATKAHHIKVKNERMQSLFIIEKFS